MKFAVELDEQQSARILDRAIRTQSQILIELSGESPGSIGGQLVSGDESVILAELTRPLPHNPQGLAGRYLDVQIFSDQRYLFTTHIVADGGRLEPTCIALEKPAVVQVLQRRRFWRARLAPSTTVRLTLRGAGRRATGEATLLNLSSEGLACRLPEAVAAGIRTGQRIDATFDLPDSAVPFAFPGTVKNKTLGADDAVIIGVQFDIEDDEAALAMQNSLRDGLYQRETELLTQEACG